MPSYGNVYVTSSSTAMNNAVANNHTTKVLPYMLFLFLGGCRRQGWHPGQMTVHDTEKRALASPPSFSLGRDTNFAAIGRTACSVTRCPSPRILPVSGRTPSQTNRPTGMELREPIRPPPRWTIRGTNTPDDKIHRLWYTLAARVLRHPVPPAPVVSATRGWSVLRHGRASQIERYARQLPSELPAHRPDERTLLTRPCRFRWP
jgi:hypothetical protein